MIKIMMNLKNMILVIKTLMLLIVFNSLAYAAKPKELNVAYFLEWPSANQVYQMDKTYDKKMGIKVNWRSFDNGNAMTQAMLAGDIDIAYSQGFVPFVVGVSKGADLKMIGIAMTYSENDNCVAQSSLGINKSNAKQKLKGLKIGTPTGNVTHYKLLKMLDHLGINPKDLTVLSMSNADASAAFVRGDIDVGCGFGGALTRMKNKGNVIMTGAEQEAIGLKVFDIVSVTGKFAEKYPEVVTQFMQLTEEANNQYNSNPSKYYSTLSKASGMNKEDTMSTLNKFTFLTTKQQLSNEWMNGGVQSFTKEVADFFVSQKQMTRSLSQAKYDQTIDHRFLKQVQ